MRSFDAIGIAAVAGWIVLSSLYVYRHEFGAGRGADELDSEIALQEGETWLLLQREDSDVGFVHRTRTRLSTGWLLEYETVMTLDLLGQTYPVRTSVKSTVDRRGHLRDARADLRLAGRRIRAQGDVTDEGDLRLLVRIGGRTRRQTLPLDGPIRLASTSVNQLLGEESLEPGTTYEETYFDPTAVGRESVALEYRGREEIDVTGQTYRAHHVVQRLRGRELDVYLEDDGTVLIQEFPLKMVGMRVPAELGRSRAASLRKEVRSLESEGEAGTGPLERLELGPVLDLLGFTPEIETRPQTGPDGRTQ